MLLTAGCWLTSAPHRHFMCGLACGMKRLMPCLHPAVPPMSQPSNCIRVVPDMCQLQQMCPHDDWLLHCHPAIWTKQMPRELIHMFASILAAHRPGSTHVSSIRLMHQNPAELIGVQQMRMCNQQVPALLMVLFVSAWCLLMLCCASG